MDVKVYVSFENDSKIAYYELGDKIYRSELYDLQELFKNLNIKTYDEGIKKGLIRECLNTDKKLIDIQTEFLRQQFNGNFLDGLQNPLDDDVKCKEMFDKILSNEIYIHKTRRIRLDKDEINPAYSPVSLENSVKNHAKILSAILKLQPILIKNWRGISEECFNRLIEHANDLEYLEKILFPLVYNSEFNEMDILTVFDKKTDINIKNGFLCRESDSKKYPELFSFNNDDISSLFSFFYGNFYLRNELFLGPNNTRIYFNIHDENVLSQFLTCYIEECLKYKLLYNMKGMWDTSPEACDTTVFYCSTENLKSSIIIIEKILLQHPEWREKFKEPIYGASRFGTGFYGVCHIGNINSYGWNDETFNNYYEHICVMSLGCMIARVAIQNKLMFPSHSQYKYFISLANLKNIIIKEGGSASQRYNVLDKEMYEICDNLVKKYIDKEIIQQGLKELGFSVFRNYMKKIHCIAQGFPIDKEVDIAVDKNMLEYFSKNKKEEISSGKDKKDPKSDEYKNEVLMQYRELLEKFNQLKTASVDTGILSYENKINDIYNNIVEKSKNGFTLEEKEELLELINRMEMIIDSKLTTKTDSKQIEKKNVLTNIKQLCESMYSFDDWKDNINYIAKMVRLTNMSKIDIKLYQKLLKDLETSKQKYLNSNDEEHSYMMTDLFNLVNDDLLSIGVMDINKNNINDISGELKYRLNNRCYKLLEKIRGDIESITNSGETWEKDAPNVYKKLIEKIQDLIEKVPMSNAQSITLYKEIFDKLKKFRFSYNKCLAEKNNIVKRLNMAYDFKREFDNPIMQLESLENDYNKGTLK